MHNYRLPRNRVKGYDSRPLRVDIVVRRNTVESTTYVKKELPSRHTPHYVTKTVLKDSHHRTKNDLSLKKSSTEHLIDQSLNKYKKSHIPIHKNKRIVYAFSIALVMIAIAVNVLNIVNRSNISSDVQAEGIGANSPNPNSDEDVTNSLSDVDETEPKKETIRSYRVANDLPRFLNIQSIGVYAKVLRVGLNSSNEILTPKNIYNVGWYEQSSKPGQPGAVFINGHVSGPTKKGVFYNIKKMNIGDIVKLETGNAEQYEYKVVHKEEVPVNSVDMNKVLRSFDIDKQGLNLMTCGGEFDKNSESYKNRIIIYAVRL